MGCGNCLNGGKRCPQKDDMAEILDKIIAADVIVMATPVYFYAMYAQMKTLIDRTCSRYTEIRNKEFVFIMTAADSRERATEKTLEGFRAFTSCLDGAKEKGIISGTGAWNMEEIKDNPVMKKAYELGAAI